MNKEKDIEEMAKTLYAPHLEEQNDGYGELCRGCQKWYEDEPCNEKHNCDYYRNIAKHLQNVGYGNVKQAVKEFAEKLKEIAIDISKDVGIEYSVLRTQTLLEQIDNLITELYGADDKE